MCEVVVDNLKKVNFIRNCIKTEPSTWSTIYFDKSLGISISFAIQSHHPKLFTYQTGCNAKDM